MNRITRRYFVTMLGLGLVLTGTDAIATQQTSGSGNIEVSAPWARASVGEKRPAAVYMTIHNAGKKDIKLVGMKTKRADTAHLHESLTEASGISFMSAVRSVVIPAGTTLKLEPKGTHVMLMGLKSPIEEGDSFDMVLAFSNGEEVTVTVPVLSIAAAGPDS